MKQVIAARQLWLAFTDDTISGAMILNHAHNERYNDFPWPSQLDDSEYLVVHTLAVGLGFERRGIAKQMLEFAKHLAVTGHLKAVRLDVLVGNVPAERLYPAAGFTLMGSIPMDYEDCGTVDTELYEWTVPPQ